MTDPAPLVARATTDPAQALERLLDIMRALRDPVTGCPWDREQDFDSIAPYTIEEAYEVADAIARRDWAGLPDELGDLLLQVVYHSSLGAEAGRFDFAAVAGRIGDKMVRRHPHVFGTAAATDAEDRQRNWEDAKAAERSGRAEHGTLAGVPVDLPALLRAVKLSARAARVGFDWQLPEQVLERLDEELLELRAELHPDPARRDAARLRDELGDVLFTAANLARKLGLNPEDCLREANHKFERRFNSMERIVEGDGRGLAGASFEEMEAGWQAAKRLEHG